VDLRGIYFPYLSELVLSHFIFSHDLQLEWILNHHALERHVLPECVIILLASWHGEIAAEGYRIDLPSYFESPSEYVYGRTWSHYFKKIADGLPKLQYFRLGKEVLQEISPKSAEYVDLLLHQKRYISLVEGGSRLVDARPRIAEEARMILEEMRKDKKAFRDLH
jgi:hypothetical protein